MIDKYKMNVNPLEDSEVSEILDFEMLPVLYVETDGSGSLYLSYLDRFIDEDIEQRLVIKISEDRLRKVKKGLLSVRSVFEAPETKFIFLTHLNQTNGKIENIYLLPNEIFQKYNTTDQNYYIFEEDEGDECVEDDMPRAFFIPNMDYPDLNIKTPDYGAYIDLSFLLPTSLRKEEYYV